MHRLFSPVSTVRARVLHSRSACRSPPSPPLVIHPIRHARWGARWRRRTSGSVPPPPLEPTGTPDQQPPRTSEPTSSQCGPRPSLRHQRDVARCPRSHPPEGLRSPRKPSRFSRRRPVIRNLARWYPPGRRSVAERPQSCSNLPTPDPPPVQVEKRSRAETRGARCWGSPASHARFLPRPVFVEVDQIGSLRRLPRVASPQHSYNAPPEPPSANTSVVAAVPSGKGARHPDILFPSFTLPDPLGPDQQRFTRNYPLVRDSFAPAPRHPETVTMTTNYL